METDGGSGGGSGANAVERLTNLHGMVLVVGNARSGSTLLGAVLDGHPNVVVANETTASATFWRGFDRERILAEILDNSEANAAIDRPSEGYAYQVGLPPSQKTDLRVVGDKIWNPATLLLHGDHGLIPSLEERLGVPVLIIHAMRNPFDTISTMHRRSGASVANRTRWYFMHCEAAVAIGERVASDRFLACHHEDLLAAPGPEIDRLCRFLGVPADAGHIDAVADKLFSTPRSTRHSVTWQPAEIAAVHAGIARFPCLARYADCDVASTA